MSKPVLLADSDPDVLMELAGLFDRRGFEVVSTHDGGDALARFFEREPAVVVCNQELPVLSGVALCQQVKSQDPSTRVVIVLSDPQLADGDVQGRSGCDTALSVDALEQRLDAMLETWALEVREAPLTNATPEAEADTVDPLAGLEDEDFDGLGWGAELGSHPEPPSESDAEPAIAAEPESEPSFVVAAESEPRESADSDPADDAPISLSLPIPIPIPIPVANPRPPAAIEAEAESEPASTSGLGDPASLSTRFGQEGDENEETHDAEQLQYPRQVQPAQEEQWESGDPSRAEPSSELPHAFALPDSSSLGEQEPEHASEFLPEFAPDTEVSPAAEFTLDSGSAGESVSDVSEVLDPSEALDLGADFELGFDTGAKSSLDTRTSLDTLFGESEATRSAIEETIAGYVAESIDAEARQESEGTDEEAIADEAAPDEENDEEILLDDIAEAIPARANGSDAEVVDDGLPRGPEGSLGLRGHQVASVPAGIPTAGDLTSTPIPRLFYELYLARFSGVLTLNRESERRRVFVWGGFPVRVETGQSSENLAVMLLRTDQIDTEAYQQVEQTIRSEGIRAGDALRKLGLLSDHQLLEAMRTLNEERLVNTFAWRDGAYMIEARLDFADGTVFSEVHPLSVIWRGIHQYYPMQSLLGYFSSLRTRYIVTGGMFDTHFQALGPFLQRFDIERLLCGSTTFEQALRSDDTRSTELAQLLYFLVVTDMVRPQVRPGPRSETLQTGARPESEPEVRAVDYRELTLCSEFIAREYLRLKDADSAMALGLDANAGALEVREALARALEPFSDSKLPPGLDDDMRRKAKEIEAMLYEAANALQSRVDFESTNEPTEDQPATDDTESPAEAGLHYYQASQSLIADGRFRDAQQQLELAIAAEPGRSRYWVGLAQAILLDDTAAQDTAHHGALNCLRRACQVDPEDGGAHLELGKLLLRVGQTREARDHLAQIEEGSPAHAEAQRLLG